MFFSTLKIDGNDDNNGCSSHGGDGLIFYEAWRDNQVEIDDQSISYFFFFHWRRRRW